jgi:hypothetical protein
MIPVKFAVSSLWLAIFFSLLLFSIAFPSQDSVVVPDSVIIHSSIADTIRPWTVQNYPQSDYGHTYYCVLTSAMTNQINDSLIKLNCTVIGAGRIDNFIVYFLLVENFNRTLVYLKSEANFYNLAAIPIEAKLPVNFMSLPDSTIDTFTIYSQMMTPQDSILALIQPYIISFDAIQCVVPVTAKTNASPLRFSAKKDGAIAVAKFDFVSEIQIWYCPSVSIKNLPPRVHINQNRKQIYIDALGRKNLRIQSGVIMLNGQKKVLLNNPENQNTH